MAGISSFLDKSKTEMFRIGVTTDLEDIKEHLEVIHNAVVPSYRPLLGDVKKRSTDNPG